MEKVPGHGIKRELRPSYTGIVAIIELHPKRQEEDAMKTAPLIPILLLATSIPAAGQPAKTVDTEKGAVLAGSDGMTLYTYKNDKKGESACYDACAKNWPPFLAGKNAKNEGAYTLVKRNNGAMQWAKDGMPLYYFVQDKKSGDVMGDGMRGMWQASRP